MDKQSEAQAQSCSSPPGTPGDLLFFQRNFYKHYVINVGNGEIIHLTARDGLGNWNIFSGGSKIMSSKNANTSVVKKEKFMDFYQEGDEVFVEKCRTGKVLPNDEIVKRAMSSIGEEGYNLFFYNCEHFARWCCYDKAESQQIEEFFKDFPSNLSLF